MPRPYHSASSIALGRNCPHAWALTYIDGLREAEIPWAEIEAGRVVEPRQRSTALGKAMHAVGEAWYRNEAPDWDSYPGKVFLSGAHLLPHPSRVYPGVHVEAPIGDVPLPLDPAKPDAPRVALSIDGVLWAGFIDLLAEADAEYARLGVNAPDGWALIDYKSTANIADFALTPDALAGDVQASLYTIAACQRLRLPSIPARWVYFETKKVRRAEAVDVTIPLERAHDTLISCNATARELDTIRDSADAPKNTNFCREYGGCRFHTSKGGPCDARARTSNLIKVRVLKGSVMAGKTFAELKAEQAAKRGGAAATTAAPAAPAAPPEPPPGPEAPPEAPPPAETAAAPRTRAPRGAKPGTGLAGIVASLSAEISEAQAAADAANERLAGLVAKLKAALP